MKSGGIEHKIKQEGGPPAAWGALCWLGISLLVNIEKLDAN